MSCNAVQTYSIFQISLFQNMPEVVKTIKFDIAEGNLSDIFIEKLNEDHEGYFTLSIMFVASSSVNVLMFRTVHCPNLQYLI